MLANIIDRVRSLDLLRRGKPTDATELSQRLLRKVKEEGVVTMNWELALALGAGRRLLYRTAYQLVIKERISMLSDPDGGVMLMTNAEFNRFLARRSGWQEEEVERQYGKHQITVRLDPLHEYREHEKTAQAEGKQVEAGQAEVKYEDIVPEEAAAAGSTLAGKKVGEERPEPLEVAAMLSDTEEISVTGPLVQVPLTSLPEEALHQEHALEIVLPEEIIHEDLVLEEPPVFFTASDSAGENAGGVSLDNAFRSSMGDNDAGGTVREQHMNLNKEPIGTYSYKEVRETDTAAASVNASALATATDTHFAPAATETVLAKMKAPAANAGRATRAFLQRIAGRVFGSGKTGQNQAAELQVDSDPAELDWFDLEISGAEAAASESAVEWQAEKGDNLPEEAAAERQSFPERSRERWGEKDFSKKNNQA